MIVLRAIAAILEVLGLGLLEELADDLVELLGELAKAVRLAAT